MTRILSALVLVPVVVGAILYLNPLGLLALAGLVALAAFVEYVRLAEALGARVPRLAGGVIVLSTLVSAGVPGLPVEVPLALAVVVLGAAAIGEARLEPATFHLVGATVLGAAWIGLPLGMLVSLHDSAGRLATLLLVATIAISDTAQFYTGTAFGRRRLSPKVSPKKSVEGAAGGFLAGMLTMGLAGPTVLPAIGVPWWVAIGAVVVAAGILGDLFESLLKRSAGVKDSSALIPGHGGVLDRIDALLFAAPVFAVLVRYLS